MALETTETYISLEDAEDYAELMELVLPEDDAELEILLRRAAIYLDRLWGSRYLGNRTNVGQVLYWPRAVPSYYDSIGNYRSDFGVSDIPLEVGYAQVELAALMYAGVDIFAQPEPRIKKTTVKIDELETSLEYADASGYATNPLYKIDGILGPVLVLQGLDIKPPITMTRGG